MKLEVIVWINWRKSTSATTMPTRISPTWTHLSTWLWMKSQLRSCRFLHHPAQSPLLTMWCAREVCVQVRALQICPVAVGGPPPPRKRHPVDELGGCSRYSCGNIRCWWIRTSIGAGQHRHTSDANSLITSLKKRSTQLVPYGTSAFTANCPRSWPRISATRLWRSDSNYCRSGRVGGAAASTAPSVSLFPAMCASSKRFHDAEEQSSWSFCNESWGTF